MKDIDKYKDDFRKLHVYLLRSRLDNAQYRSSERLGPEGLANTYNFFCANVDGQHRAKAVYSVLYGLPIRDQTERHYNCSVPHLRKEMDCYEDSEQDITLTSQVLMKVPFIVSKFTRKQNRLRALSDATALSAQDSSGATEYAVLSSTMTTLRTSSDQRTILHANKGNILQQKSATIEEVLSSTRNATAAAMITNITPTTKWGRDEIRRLTKLGHQGSDETKLKMIHEDLTLLANGIQKRDKPATSQETHIVCYGKNHFERHTGKSDLYPSPKLRGTMAVLAMIALDREAISNFLKALQMDPTIADQKSLEMMRAHFMHVATIVAGGKFKVVRKYSYGGLFKNNVKKIPAYKLGRLESNVYWNAIAQSARILSRVAMATKGFTMTTISDHMMRSSWLARAYDSHVRLLNAEDSESLDVTDEVREYRLMIEWIDGVPPRNLLEFAAKSYPFILEANKILLQDDAMKRIMTVENATKWFVFPSTTNCKNGKGLAKIDRFNCDSPMIFILEDYRLDVLVRSHFFAESAIETNDWVIPRAKPSPKKAPKLPMNPSE